MFRHRAGSEKRRRKEHYSVSIVKEMWSEPSRSPNGGAGVAGQQNLSTLVSSLLKFESNFVPVLNRRIEVMDVMHLLCQAGEGGDGPSRAT